MLYKLNNKLGLWVVLELSNAWQKYIIREYFELRNELFSGVLNTFT